MRPPIHAINSGRREMTPERIIGIGFVGLLHVIAIWAIVTGLGRQIVHTVLSPDLVMIETHDAKKQPPPPAPPKMPTVDIKTPVQPSVPIPVIDIQPDRQTPITTQPPPLTPPSTNSVPDTAAAGVASTHTTPPYPMLERRLGNQGTVKLRLTISPQGVVTAADIVQSSGFPGLDQAAMSWVLQHWKYKPAIQRGVSVGSTTVAAVVFNIKNAG